MNLKWSLAELRKYQNDLLLLDREVDMTNSLKSRKRDLIDAQPIKVTGAITMESLNKFYVDLSLATTLTLPSSRTLEPVDFELTATFSEVYLAPGVNQEDMDDLDEEVVFSLEKDILDLQKPIEDTILASIPIKILSEEELTSDERPHGNDWELTLEGEDSRNSFAESDISENSPFSILKDLNLFNEEEE